MSLRTSKPVGLALLSNRLSPGPAISNRGNAYKDAYRLIEGMIWKQNGYLSATNVGAIGNQGCSED